MDLLNENEEQKNKKTKGQKLVLTLLIISIVLLIAVIILMIFIEPSNEKNNKSLLINGVEQSIANNNIIESNSGTKYIALNYLCDVLGYYYENSDYQTYNIDTTKCYIQNNKYIYGFENNSKLMYKYEEGTKLDYQYYTMNNTILTYNNKLYIAIEDLPVALNIKSSSNSKNTISIQTANYLAEQYQAKLTEYSITKEEKNIKALAYDWIIASKNNMWGVLNQAGETVVSFRYDTIEFNEYGSNYIVSKDGQFGIISTTGTTEQILVYDDIQVLNYENELYKVKNNNKFGILDKNGKIRGEIIYDDIGFPEDQSKKILYTLIIPEISDEEIYIPATIVVKANNKYGLILLENGQEALKCDHLDKLYESNEFGNKVYKIEAENQTIDLKSYLQFRQINYQKNMNISEN